MTAKKVGADLDAMLERAFAEFHTGLVRSSGWWFGKERDCVNRFVMGHLLPACSTGKYIVKDPAQVGIEMGVAQPRRIGTKPAAPKDVVIWREKFSTCWNSHLKPVTTPLAVIEWKVRHPKAAKQSIRRATSHDRRWLGAFTAQQNESLGYSVYLEWTPDWAPRTFVVARCTSGEWDEEWFVRP
jgi:hypothetical protein